MAEAMGQLDLLALLEPEPDPWEVDRDAGAAMLERVVEAGLADGYSVGCGYHPHVQPEIVLEGIWATPSRLMSFPYRFRLADEERPNRIVARHPLLAAHPQIVALAKFTGWPVVDPVGSDAWGEHGTWHHAVDLVSDGLWRLLLETRQFTTIGDLLGAASYGLDYGHLSTADARTFLAESGADEPTDPGPDDALRLVKLTESNGTRHTSWMLGPGTLANVWGRLVGIERGWFKMRGGFLTWTDAALAQHQAAA